MRTVLITGTSSGIGLETTVALAERGWRVFATMRRPERRAALEEALTRAGLRARVDISRLDVTDPAGIRAAVATVLEQTGGRLDAVVHNAGIAIASAFEDLPETELRRVMETNFFGVTELTRVLLPTFRAQRQGRIVIVSSDSAFAGEPCNAIYCASKWAIEGWAEALVYEIEPFGIDLVLIEPGTYRTEIWNNSPWIVPPDSGYAALLTHLRPEVEGHVAAYGRHPREVALTIDRALAARRPRFRYPVGPLARAGHFMRGKVPSRILRRIVARALRLHKMRL